ncbi:phosphoadenosine phosphosulfate reductase family protein [Paraclostridium bifermentans]|uniref:phosphoadenosine phosphosulfate reductase domain-containing protein n=2 Tax=Paraclostridium bifermentans TaxID=1490 RepID=UPI001D030BC0|nr:phosphoadenosine phosphosulfate reductase family protein [Paraclostridium bifermentans]
MVQETKLNIMIPDKKVIDITTYIASFSGGKDSIAMVLRLIEENKPLDRVAFIDTELEFGEQNNIIKICERKFKELKPGLEFDYIRPVKTFEEYFYTVKKKGKFKGQIYGWPFTAGFNSWCNDRLKQRPFRKYQKQFDNVIIYLGIAADEPKRLKRLEGNRRAPLAEWGMTEKDCLKYIKEKGFWNPMYWKFERLGCYLCPKQNNKSLKVLRRRYPYLWEKMLRMDKDSPIPFRADGTTLQELEHRFKYEESQRIIAPLPLVERHLFYENEQTSLL